MTLLFSIAERISALKGWSRRGAAFGAGVMCALAMAPLYLLPLMALGVSLLILALDGAAREKRKARAAFALGWFFGFGYFLIGLYWMAFSFLVQAEEFAWMAPIAITGLPAFLALFHGAAASIAVLFWRPGWRRVLLLAVALMFFEYLRGHILTGLPWNLPGQALAGSAVGAQFASVGGVYLLSLAALLISGCLVAFADTPKRAPLGLALTIGGAAMLYGFGVIRLATNPPEDNPQFTVRVVQPNIPQKEKIDGRLWQRNFERSLALSTGPAPQGRGLFIIWPENAVPVIDEVESALLHLTEKLPANAVLLTGAVRRATETDGVERYYNSLALIPPGAGATRTVTAHYDKHHLVPFGEYLPLQGLLRAIGLAQLAPYDDGFTKGKGPATFVVAGSAFSPLICYEAIFPGRSYPKDARPDWLVTVTNDAWFGDTSGPRQHFDQARLRAIETGLPMVRSANTGVSGVIDASGRTVSRLPLYEAGVIETPLPQAGAPTLYAQFGDAVFWLIWIAVAMIGLFPLGAARRR